MLHRGRRGIFGQVVDRLLSQPPIHSIQCARRDISTDSSPKHLGHEHPSQHHGRDENDCRGWKKPLGSSCIEAAKRDASAAAQLTGELARDKKAGDHEEDIYADEAS
jgi:hypothetical protein